MRTGERKEEATEWRNRTAAGGRRRRSSGSEHRPSPRPPAGAHDCCEAREGPRCGLLARSSRLHKLVELLRLLDMPQPAWATRVGLNVDGAHDQRGCCRLGGLLQAARQFACAEFKQRAVPSSRADQCAGVKQRARQFEMRGKDTAVPHDVRGVCDTRRDAAAALVGARHPQSPA